MLHPTGGGQWLLGLAGRQLSDDIGRAVSFLIPELSHSAIGLGAVACGIDTLGFNGALRRL